MLSRTINWQGLQKLSEGVVGFSLATLAVPMALTQIVMEKVGLSQPTWPITHASWQVALSDIVNSPFRSPEFNEAVDCLFVAPFRAPTRERQRRQLLELLFINGDLIDQDRFQAQVVPIVRDWLKSYAGNTF